MLHTGKNQAGPDGILEDSPVFQLQASTNTTSGCINYWLALEAKKELGKDRQMRIIIIIITSAAAAVFSLAHVPDP